LTDRRSCFMQEMSQQKILKLGRWSSKREFSIEDEKQDEIKTCRNLKTFGLKVVELVTDVVAVQQWVRPWLNVQLHLYNFAALQSDEIPKNSKIRCSFLNLEVQLMALFENLYESFELAEESVGCRDSSHQVKISLYIDQDALKIEIQDNGPGLSQASCEEL